MTHKRIVTAGIIATIIFYSLVGLCLADCQDPTKLSPDLQKAYFELKKSGFDVSIRCQGEDDEKTQSKEDQRVPGLLKEVGKIK